MKPRPIVRLARLMIAHSLLVSVLCCSSGILALLLLPVLAKNTYVSENALIPGSANTMLSPHDTTAADRLMKEITGTKSRSTNSGIEIPRLIAEYMADVGAEVSYQKFYPQSNQFDPLQFFAGPDSGVIQENCSCSSHGINTVGIIRAPRGDGKEAMVLVTPYDSVKIDPSEVVSLGMAYSVFSLLSQVTWLAKDVIWLAADSQYGEYTSVAAWLRDYHNPSFSGIGWNSNSEICDENNNIYELKRGQSTERKISNVFQRGGTMAAALVIKVVNRGRVGKDTLRIYAEASNGQMPNLDLINVVNFLAAHRQGFQVKVEKLWSFIDSQWIKNVGEFFEFLGKVARSLNPQWKFGIPVADYIDGFATLASSLYFQALGVPTGPHGAFRDYQVDAITLEVSPGAPLNKKSMQNEFLLQVGRLTEGVIRSVNNLLEKFHQSFFLYLLASPSKFVSVGVYMIAFALLVAPLPIVAASLHTDANVWDSPLKKGKTKSTLASATTDHSMSAMPWKWLHAAKNVFIVHLWGIIVSLFPYVICQIPNLTPTICVLTWVLLSMLSLPILYLVLGSPFAHYRVFQPENREWAILKSVMVSTAFIGLCLMSVINFATAEIGALLLVPMCLLAHPLKLDYRASNLRAFTRAACNMIFGLLMFPPAAFLVLKVIFEGFDSLSVGDFWTWLHSLWAWKSATYLYVVAVHLPCWALSLHVFLHPC